jgi:acyl-CoA synthetase (AMP-forming)/AMP-acid ligase II
VSAPAPATTCNIASHLPAMAARQPDKAAVIVPAGRDGSGKARWAQWTFAELDEASDRIAIGLESVGIRRGVRTVLMVKPSLDFFALVFALYKVGAVLVLIDPGIGTKALKTCLREVEPEAFVGVPAAHVARLVFRGSLRTVRINVTVGPRLFWGGHTLAGIRGRGPYVPYAMAATDPDDVAAILFTSGSTGIPKGAVYTHGMFDAQVRMLKAIYRFGDDEIDLPTFPLFALFDPALGTTAVIPDMDARKPGSADPRKIVEAIQDHGCTTMFGSPALLRNLARHAVAHDVRLPTLRRVLSAGAPVPHDVLADMHRALSDGVEVFTPYGATESLPVANIGSREVLADTLEGTATGQGICVGRPVDGALVRVIRITDDPIPTWSDELVLPDGAVGEITVRGPMVTRSYFARPDQTAKAKIDEGGAVVHRMGDLGRFDAQGRLWMCGRKAHRVTTPDGPVFTVPVERVFDVHGGVLRTALVGIGAPGQQRPRLLVEREPTCALSDADLLDELRAIGAAQTATAGITDLAVYPGSFPVDIRHNAKIQREALAAWANRRGA